jgi:hypothetical protein
VSNIVSVTLTDPAGAVIAQGTTTDPTICGNSDGSIEITGLGTGDLAYTGTVIGTDIGVTLPFTTSTFTAGTYDFTFTQGACVSNTISVTLTDPAANAITDGGFVDPSTCGATDGQIIVTGIGTGDLTWTGTNPGNIIGYISGDVIPNLSAGIFDFTFTQGVCISNTLSITLTNPAANPISDGGFLDPTICAAADGQIIVTGIGTGDLTWTGTNPGNIIGYNSGDVIPNLSAGIFDFTFNQGVCVSNTLSITLTNPAGTAIADGGFVNPTICGAADGQITVAGIGTGNLTWTGTNPGNIIGYNLGDVIPNLSAGFFDFTFTQGVCVSNTISIVLTGPAPAVIADGGFINPTTCAGADGQITIAGIGTGDLTWTGTNPGNIIAYNLGDVIPNLNAGNYDFTLAQGTCTSNTISFILTDPTPALISDGGFINPSTCGASDGQITIAGTGTGDLSWSGTTPGNIIGYNLGDVIPNFIQGTFTFTFLQNACLSNTVSISLIDPSVVVTPLISASGPTSFCIGDNVILTSSSASNNLWSTGETAQTITVSTNQSITVTVTDGFCSETSANENIVVNITPPTAPIISVSGSTSFCIGDNVILTSSYASGNVWSTGETTDFITVSTTEDIDVTINVGGCFATSILESVVANPIPLTPIITSNGASPICSGSTIQLTSSSATNNLWSNTQTSQNTNVGTSGNYTVTVTELGCSATSAPFSVTVNPTPNAPLVFVTGSTTFCAGGSVELTSSIPTGIVWSNGATTATIITSTTGTYNVSYTVNGCSSPSQNINVVAHPLPSVSLANYQDVCNVSGNFALTQGIPSGGNYSVNGVQSTSFNPLTANLGINTIDYDLIDENGCFGFATNTINVYTCVGLEEENEIDFNIYPNPSSGIFYLKGDNLNSIKKLSVQDEIGRTIYMTTYTNDINSIDLREYSVGFYYVVIEGDNFNVMKKIQVVQ